MKINKTEIDIQSAGLLLFLADNANSQGLVKMGVREISRHVGKNPVWVSRHIKALNDVKLIQNEPLQGCVTGNIGQIKVLKCCITVSYKLPDKSGVLQDGVTEKFKEIWKYYRRDGSKGDKTRAYKNYLNLSQKEKEEMAKALPYYMAFTLPKFRPMMYKFIKEKTWQYPIEFKGRVIPMDNYNIANTEAFKEWFNKAVEGTDIPPVTEVTPERHVNLNICYTLYPKLMSQAMDIVTNNDFYLKKAKEGWLTFDKIFDPACLIEICEKGYKQQ